MKLRTTLALTTWMLAMPTFAFAQPPEGPMRDRARTFLVLRLAEALDLPDEKALEVSRILKGSEETRAKLQTERGEVETRIREALDAPPADTAKLEGLIARADEIDRKMALVPAQSLGELRKILTVEQQAKLVLARPKIHREIRGAMRRRMEGRFHGEGPDGRRPFGGPGERPRMRPPHRDE